MRETTMREKTTTREKPVPDDLHEDQVAPLAERVVERAAAAAAAAVGFRASGARGGQRVDEVGDGDAAEPRV